MTPSITKPATGLWLRASTAKMFNMARIPKPSCDILSKPPQASNPEAQKIYIMIHNWCYAIPVYHPTSPPKSVSVQEIETRIRSAVIDAEQRLAAGERAVPIGALTADQRDKWMQVRSRIPFFSSRSFLFRICSIFSNCHPKTREPIKSSVSLF